MGLGLSVGVGFGSWGVEGVPAHRVDGHVVALVGLEVGRVVRLGALVDAPLLGAHEEEVLGQPREVEAAASRQAAERGVVVALVARGLGGELKLHDVRGPGKG